MATHVRISAVAHVGAMDPLAKNPGSFEGRGLSVSLHPSAWAMIAKLGDEGFVLEGRGNFLDAHSVTPTEQAHIEAWAVQTGLAEYRDVVVLRCLDDETGEWESFEFGDLTRARYEATQYEHTRIEHREGVLCATAGLAVRSGHDPVRIMSGPSALVFDLVLIAYVEDDPSTDGIWWHETYDPVRLSAPRGVIFNDRISDFTATNVTWEGLVEFERVMNIDVAARSQPRFLLA